MNKIFSHNRAEKGEEKENGNSVVGVDIKCTTTLAEIYDEKAQSFAFCLRD